VRREWSRHYSVFVRCRKRISANPRPVARMSLSARPHAALTLAQTTAPTRPALPAPAGACFTLPTVRFLHPLDHGRWLHSRWRYCMDDSLTWIPPLNPRKINGRSFRRGMC
jgi:hypothetical protein